MTIYIKIILPAGQVRYRQCDVSKVLRIAAALVHQVRMTKSGVPRAILNSQSHCRDRSIRQLQIAQTGKRLKRGGVVVPEIVGRLTCCGKTHLHTVISRKVDVQQRSCLCSKMKRQPAQDSTEADNP